jgi:uncharacterized protein YigE (DUF2233 family)
MSLFLGINAPKNDGNELTNNKSLVEQYYEYNVIKIKNGSMTFGVSDNKPKSSDFYINSNFFKTNSTIGLVVMKGKTYNKKVKGGGYFYVKGNKAFVSSKTCPKNTDYVSQTILWAFDNGKVNTSLFKKSHANKKRYRTLMGQNKSGDIIVISSNMIGFVTIPEIVEFSKKFNIVDGILLDGGSSVDYRFKNDSEDVSFSIPSQIKSFMKIKQPTTYIYGNFN